MATVELSNVCKVQGGQNILNHLSMVIEKGEFIVVVGPSGCGKTTLLRLIAGLDSVTSGSIRINQQCINTIAPKERDIAMVFQQYALYPHMTVYKNIAYGLRLRKYPKNIIHQRVTEVAEKLGLTACLYRKPLGLSGGQKQRVAMGRAIVRQPSLFLFDEPLSNLDANLRSKMRYEMKKLHQELQTTSLYVTHDQIEAMTLATRLVVLHQGKIEQMGTPRVIYQEPASLFVAQFMSYYPLNVFSGRIDEQGKKVVMKTGDTFTLATPLSCHQEVWVGIRPEQVVLRQSDEENIPWHVDSVDDMGADKLLTLVHQNGKSRMVIKTAQEILFAAQKPLCNVRWKALKGHVFDKITGKRVGEWHEE